MGFFCVFFVFKKKFVFHGPPATPLQPPGGPQTPVWKPPDIDQSSWLKLILLQKVSVYVLRNGEELIKSST